MGVWIFSIFYLSVTLFAMAGWIVVLTDAIPLDGPEREYYENLAPLDYALTFGLALTTLAAAVSLLSLSRLAFPLFTSCLAVGLLQTAWHFAARGLGAVVGGASLAGMILQWSLLLWVCIYSWRLRGKGLLR